MYNKTTREGVYNKTTREGVYNKTTREGVYNKTTREGVYNKGWVWWTVGKQAISREWLDEQDEGSGEQEREG